MPAAKDIPLMSKVMPREGHGSRNGQKESRIKEAYVMPREGHGSRNRNSSHTGQQ